MGRMEGSTALMDGTGRAVCRSSFAYGWNAWQHARRGAGRRVAMFLAAPLLAMTIISGPALAQQSGNPAPSGADEPVVVQPDNSLPDTVQTPAFAAFWQRFRAAVRANDRGQLQALTHLPFDFNGKSYGAPDFAALARQLYDAKTRHCLLSETPLHDQDMYEVFCGETVYVFGTDPDLPDYAASNPDGSAWRLIEIGAND
ncbi:MAG TPA: hypothetical protein VL462_00065 [Candidatus Nitrosotalea sp.]|nr:hypothetical protein [Candidatus Nitrosotalea sp.]